MRSLAWCSAWGHRVGHSLATEQQQQLLAVGNLPLLIINFSYLEGVSTSAKQLKDIILCICWWGTRTLPQVASVVSQWLVSPLSHIPSSSLIYNFFCLPIGTQERSCWMKTIFCNQRNGGIQKSFVPGSPIGPCSLSVCVCVCVCVLLTHLQSSCRHHTLWSPNISVCLLRITISSNFLV